tara:strand:- start:1244 stop:1543 length:300 start_codon:yes stop_codon:yes gene_type:complete
MFYYLWKILPITIKKYYKVRLNIKNIYVYNSIMDKNTVIILLISFFIGWQLYENGYLDNYIGDGKEEEKTLEESLTEYARKSLERQLSENGLESHVNLN